MSFLLSFLISLKLRFLFRYFTSKREKRMSKSEFNLKLTNAVEKPMIRATMTSTIHININQWWVKMNELWNWNTFKMPFDAAVTMCWIKYNLSFWYNIELLVSSANFIGKCRNKQVVNFRDMFQLEVNVKCMLRSFI